MNITIGRRTFEVRESYKDPEEPGLPTYWLKGARGAEYYTMRNRNNPSMMFLMNAKRMGVDPLGPLWLTDKNGKLEVAG